VDELISDGCIRIAFPDGATFAMRVQKSGVVLDRNAHPVFPEFATELAVHRAQTLAAVECVGVA
jgi:hypothetical protein